MNMNKVLWTLTLTAGGVLLAGFIMANFRDIDLIDKAHEGFDS